MPPPTAVMTRESFRESRMVLMKAMRKKRRDMGMNLPQRPSRRENCWTMESRAAKKRAIVAARGGRVVVGVEGGVVAPLLLVVRLLLLLHCMVVKRPGGGQK